MNNTEVRQLIARLREPSVTETEWGPMYRNPQSLEAEAADALEWLLSQVTDG